MIKFALSAALLLLAVPAFAADQTKTITDKLTEYCATEGLPAGGCEANQYLELRGSCDAGTTLAAVSCGMASLDGGPNLVENAIGPDKYARCVWHYPSAPPAYALPTASITMRCASP